MSKVTTIKDFNNGLKVQLEVDGDTAEIVVPVIKRSAKAEDGASIIATGEMNCNDWTVDEVANYINFAMTSIKAITETYGGKTVGGKPLEAQANIDLWLGVIEEVISNKNEIVTSRMVGRKSGSGTTSNKKVILEAYLNWIDENVKAIIDCKSQFAVQATIDDKGACEFITVDVDNPAILTVLKAGLAGMGKPQLVALYKENTNLLASAG